MNVFLISINNTHTRLVLGVTSLYYHEPGIRIIHLNPQNQFRVKKSVEITIFLECQKVRCVNIISKCCENLLLGRLYNIRVNLN